MSVVVTVSLVRPKTPKQFHWLKEFSMVYTCGAKHDTLQL